LKIPDTRRYKSIVNDESSTPLVRRRTFLWGSLGAGVLAFVALMRLPRLVGTAQSGGEPTTTGLKVTMLAFLGALFGRDLSSLDSADLSDRLDELFTAGGPLLHDAVVLARRLDEGARRQGASGFESCNEAQKERIVEQIMSINPRSLRARVLSHLSRDQRDRYRMRWSIVPQLVWLYRHSAAAWRARGYTRWPGIAGDWHEVLVPGAPYP
jgi:hypothetical protein